MANISVTPPVYDRNDPEGTIKKLCEYSAKLQEELQWVLTQMEKQIEK
jgi:hypothetical protein